MKNEPVRLQSEISDPLMNGKISSDEKNFQFS